MSIDKLKSMSAVAEMRRHTEEQLKENTSEMDSAGTGGETEVSHYELELQNAELCSAKGEVENNLAKYIDLYDFAPVGYFTLDRNGAISAVNLVGASQLGIEREALPGQRFELFVSVNTRQFFAYFLEKVFASRAKESCEVALTREGDHLCYVQIEAEAAASGDECRIVTIDVTVRRQTENVMREIEARIYRLVETAVDAIIVFDGSGMVTFCNAAAEKMFNHPASEITCHDFHGLFISNHIIHASKLGFENFKEEGTGPLIGRTNEIAALRKDGTEFPLEISVSSLKIQGAWHAIAIMRALTERKF